VYYVVRTPALHGYRSQLRVHVPGVDGSSEGSEKHDRRSHREEIWLEPEEGACEG
jgi:hypothetical protein